MNLFQIQLLEYQLFNLQVLHLTNGQFIVSESDINQNQVPRGGLNCII